MLESLLDDEAHRLDLGTSLLAEIHHTLGCVTIGEEVVDENHVVLRSQIAVAHTNRIVTILGKRVNHRGNHTLHRLRLLFLDEDNRKIGQVTHHDGRSDARSLNSNNLVVLDVLEKAHEFLSQVHHQDWVHLMIYEAIYF